MSADLSYNLYSVYDKVAEQAGPIFQAVNDGVALRQFKNVLKGVDAPDDFELRRIGRFNTYKCKIEAVEQPLIIDVPLLWKEGEIKQMEREVD